MLQVICWEVASLRPPYDGVPPLLVAHRVAYENDRLEVSGRSLPWVTTILQQCFVNDPASRPSFGQLVAELELVECQ